jgi:transcriptional regulator with XRE-family HTH domain
MTAIALSPEQVSRTREAARAIGAEIRRAREALGYSQRALVDELDVHMTTFGKIERGESTNVKLGSLVKLLDYFGLTLVAAPRTTINHNDRVSSIIDRLLAFPGGEDLMRHHLKQRGLTLARGAQS